MPVLLTNNAVSRLASSLTSGATALSVSAGEGAKFPAPSAGSWFPVTLIKASGSLEIVRCTARSGDVLTVVRAQEGTSAQAFAAGDRAELRLTAGAVADVVDMINTLRNDALLDANNLSDVADKAAARSNLQLTAVAITAFTQSVTDTVLGRVVKVRDYGLGGAIDLGNTDLNEAVVSGFYRTNVNANAPAAGANFSPMIVLRSNDTIAQIIVSYTTGTIYVRAGNPSQAGGAGSWGAWGKVYSSLNSSATIDALMGAADQAAARTAIGAIDGPGVRQTWQDVTSTRAVATTYTNSTGKPISVMMNIATNSTGTSATFTIDSVIVGHWFNDGGRTSPSEFIVPAGSTYRLALVAGSIGITKWAELR